MVNKIKSCVFISGNGSNLNSLIKSSRGYNFPIKIELIISNNKKAKGLDFAKKYNIPFKFFAYDSKKRFERNSLYEIKKRKIRFLCLAGFLKILSKLIKLAHKQGNLDLCNISIDSSSIAAKKGVMKLDMTDSRRF